MSAPAMTGFLYASPHDAYTWARERRNSRRLADLAVEVGERLPTVETLMRDLFLAFYRAEVRWDEDVPRAGDDATAVNHAVVERVLLSPSYHRLHPATRGRIGDAILVTAAFTRVLAASLDDELVEFLGAEAEFHAEREALAAEAEALSELIERKARPRKPAGSGARTPEEMNAGERRERLAEVSTEMERLEHQRLSSYQRNRVLADLRFHLDEADVPGQIGEISTALGDFHRALAAWGEEDADERALDLDERLVLFRRLMADDGLRRATELLGRARTRAAGAHRSLTPAAPVRLDGVRMGDNLAQLVPTEGVLLTDPDAELEFYRRFASEELLVRHYEERATPSRGPLVVLLDESASMSGEPDHIAKSIALAVIGIARTDRRAAALIEFASHGEQRVSHFAASESRISEVAEVLTHFFGGGTSFDAPLLTALDLVARDARYAEADLVMITDGQGRLHPDTVTALREAKTDGVRLFAVSIGAAEAVFGALADQVWDGIDLSREERDPKLLPELVRAIH